MPTQVCGSWLACHIIPPWAQHYTSHPEQLPPDKLLSKTRMMRKEGDGDVLPIDSCQSRDEVDGWTLSKGKE